MAKIAAAAFLAVADAGTLAVTWSDCGATHAVVQELKPLTITTGGTTTLCGHGPLDEDLASATFSSTVSAKGVKLVECSGPGSEDVECKLPLGAGSITLQGKDFPISPGDVEICVDVQTSQLIPASLAAVDVHIEAQDPAGESVICIDVHTQKQQSLQADIDCSTSSCAEACNCVNAKCDVDSCLADSACTAAQSCAMKCACGDDACAMGCAAASPSDATNSLLGCWSSLCKTTTAQANIDCSTSSCAEACNCVNAKCDVDSCLADSACTAAQSCAMKCACGDDACAMGCAAASPSDATNSLLGCWSSLCKTTNAITV